MSSCGIPSCGCSKGATNWGQLLISAAKPKTSAASLEHERAQIKSLRWKHVDVRVRSSERLRRIASPSEWHLSAHTCSAPYQMLPSLGECPREGRGKWGKWPRLTRSMNQ